MLRAPLSAVLPAFLIIHCLPGTALAFQDAPKLSIVIVEGEGAINNARQRVNREPIVQIEDENHKPIAGAAVVFFLPGQGPGGIFADGSKSFTTITDAQGRAVMRGFKPNNLQGKFDIRVTASKDGQTVSTNIHQSTASGGGSGSSGLSAGAKWGIIIAIAAGAAVGIVVGTQGGGSSSTGTPVPPAVIPTVITPGTPTVGGPK